MNYNKVMLAGNLTRDPEKFDCKPGGCKFTIAVQGYKEKVDFIPCVAFGKTAELILKYCTKGKAIFIEGMLNSNKSGDKTYYSVAVNNMQFLSPAIKKESDKKESENPFGG